MHHRLWSECPSHTIPSLHHTSHVNTPVLACWKCNWQKLDLHHSFHSYSHLFSHDKALHYACVYLSPRMLAFIKDTFAFIKAVRELTRCDSNLLACHQHCILTNPSGPVSTPQPAGGGPVWLPVEKTRHYCSFFPLISLITFANQINPSGSLWRAASCNLKGPPSNLHLIRCKCVTSVSNQ